MWSTVRVPLKPPPRTQVPVNVPEARASVVEPPLPSQTIVPEVPLGLATVLQEAIENGEELPVSVQPPKRELDDGLFGLSGPKLT